MNLSVLLGPRQAPPQAEPEGGNDEGEDRMEVDPATETPHPQATAGFPTALFLVKQRIGTARSNLIAGGPVPTQAGHNSRVNAHLTDLAANAPANGYAQGSPSHIPHTSPEALAYIDAEALRVELGFLEALRSLLSAVLGGVETELRHCRRCGDRQR
ncbi:hypothetical protein FA13DRAFT_1793420 [Coprinellus micaceus]|uniref:Uncharacterized protein n=1 Tax=Coprinellus micaceus TaxID=71717 RepID=A0A4Y7T5Y4_COPMI|nr:hypothetical protein FA13DRAFT_1793420 [Coprinellus micaceus]